DGAEEIDQDARKHGCRLDEWQRGEDGAHPSMVSQQKAHAGVGNFGAQRGSLRKYPRRAPGLAPVRCYKTMRRPSGSNDAGRLAVESSAGAGLDRIRYLSVTASRLALPAPKLEPRDEETDMKISRVMTLASLGAVLWIPCALAADPPAAMPGDDALTCEQLYAQGSAEAQRDQQERARKNEEMRNQRRATAALVTGAVLTGGMGGTAQAAQKAVEAQTDKQMSELSGPQSNPRMEHLKRLWAQKHCVRKG
ncbi:MAG: hypothetical protein ACXWKD_14535, partial [Caldimonas sp.]